MLLVGIGASAGGLEALIPFVSNLPQDRNISYIVVQHLAKQHPSALAELLRNNTALAVEEIRDGSRPKPRVIYVCPYNNDVLLENNRFKLKPATGNRPTPCIDDFLISLAQSYRDQAIGVILSGNGQDGAIGIQAIREAGGITIAQTCDSAFFPSMPQAAHAIGNADLILTPKEAALQLSLIAERLESIVNLDNSEDIKPIIDEILKVTNIDFVNYKRSTLCRQIQRRMTILRMPDIQTYYHYLLQTPQEPLLLANNFLIRVTSFFRNEQCFEALKQALQQVLKNKTPGDEVRIWTPGCSTGEEAYSIAILLAEQLGVDFSRFRIQIYGTDINEEAIKIARKGLYPKGLLKGMAHSIREQYFEEHEDGYTVCKSLRECVIFSRHDVIKDPPFIRLDLISCRNLLIYLNQSLQEKVLTLFHYALHDHGVLFLGQAESLWGLQDAFIELDRNSKLFLKNNTRVIRPELGTKTRPLFPAPPSENYPPPVNQSYKQLAMNKLIENFSPPSILANREGRILEFFNDCDHIIKIPRGEADFNLYSIIEPALKAELKAFCYHALTSKTAVSSHISSLQLGGEKRHCRLIVTPLAHPQNYEPLLLISFQLRDATENDDNDALDLRHELQTSRETLRTVTEALEQSVNQLQILTEEAQTTQEELQSSNEELETSNEELQSINEELTLVNDELTRKSHDLTSANDDLCNILESLQKAVLVVDRQLMITRYNQNSQRFLNIPSTPKPYYLANLDDQLNCDQLVHYTRQVIQTKQSAQHRLSHLDQHYQLNIYPYLTRDNEEATGAILTIKDVTEQHLAEQQIQLAANVFEAANEAIAITDQHNRIISINPAFTLITGYTKEEVIGKNPNLLSSGRHDQDFYQRLWETLQKRGCWQGEIWNKRKNGEIYPEWVSISTIKDENNKIIRHIAVFSDISESFKNRQIILKQANYDTLTNLPNRNLFYDRLEQAMKKIRRSDGLLAVMFIDLDGFKTINDALGHSQGDIVLQQVAQRMRGVFREADTFARFGGDEFTVLLTDLQSVTDAMPVAEKILDVIQTPIIADEHELNITASIGITLYPNDGDDIETLLKHADNAMYAAKAEGRNTYRFFTQVMHEKAREQHRIANDIKNAVKFNNFELHYQPVYDFNRQCIIGAEALIRWRHPIRGFISPEEFIPIAENLNLISKIGDYVLDQACRFIADINRRLTAPLSIAVNFSPGQFLPANCADKWLEIIDNSGVEHNLVVVEITENLMMSHHDRYLKQLEKLRQHGIKIALDDFGTGFSSLSYLKKLPFDILKIDKSFIRDILIDDSDAALVESILSIAAIFSLEVIAEGVEEQGQADFLITRRCGFAQGYHYSRPLPAEEFQLLLEQTGPCSPTDSDNITATDLN